MIYRELEMKAGTYEEPAKLCLYLLDNSPEMAMGEKRPLVLICPGGGYFMTSDREAEPLAVSFLAAGFHAAVLRYSCYPASYPTALLQVASSVKYLREHAEEFHMDPEKLILQGSSAGGHLAASYGVFWRKKNLAEELHTREELLRPNGLILSYPVITSGEKAHRDSFKNLLGSRYEELVEEMSLENQVDENTPQTFLWHTASDDCVPVENSLLFFGALHEKGIPAEMHIYPRGGHGLGLADERTATPEGYAIQRECTNWFDMAVTWIKNL